MLALQAALNTAIATLGLPAVSAKVCLTGDSKIIFTPHRLVHGARLRAAVKVSAAPRPSRSTRRRCATRFDERRDTTQIGRRLEINTRWIDGAFQELGLTASPTPFDYQNLPSPYVNGHTDPIDFTMHVNGVERAGLHRLADEPEDINALSRSSRARVEHRARHRVPGRHHPAQSPSAASTPTSTASSPDYCSGTGNRVILKGGTA